MKLIIAGGRDCTLTEAHFTWLDTLPNVTEVVSGGARGADAGGEKWGTLRGLRVTTFPAQWGLHGRAAGPLRNEQMAKYADALAAFPGGRGTSDMMRRAKAHSLEIFTCPEF